jgi:hypothetical protein
MNPGDWGKALRIITALLAALAAERQRADNEMRIGIANLNYASEWRNRAINAEEELTGTNRLSRPASTGEPTRNG